MISTNLDPTNVEIVYIFVDNNENTSANVEMMYVFDTDVNTLANAEMVYILDIWVNTLYFIHLW